MIKEFVVEPSRDTGVINRGMFEEIRKIYSKDPMLAGELAISLFELVLCGDWSSDDFTIEVLLTNHKIIVEKNQKRYDKKIVNQNQSKITQYQLDEIADLYNEGFTQVEIAKKLGLTQQKVSYRINNMIRTDFPELLTKNTKNTYLNNNDNENNNDNDNKKDKYGMKSLADSSTPSTPSQGERDQESNSKEEVIVEEIEPVRPTPGGFSW